MSETTKSQKPSLYHKLETAILGIMHSLKSSVTDYCDIETIDGDFNIVLQNGALMTILAYDGTRTIIGENVFNSQIETISNSLNSFLSKSGHQFGMVFRRDLNATSDLYTVAESKKATAERLGLDFDDLIDETVDVYSKFVYDETNYIVLISHKSLLDKAEIELERKRKLKVTREFDMPGFKDAQNVLLLNSFLKAQHETYVERVISCFSNFEFAAQVRKLNVVEAFRSIKRSISPQTQSPHWMPQIPNMPKGYRNTFRWKTSSDENDASHVLWKPLPEQLMRSTIFGMDNVSSGTYPSGSVITEDRIYAPLIVDIPPQTSVTFNDLFVGLNNSTTKLPDGTYRALPYSISFMLNGDGLAGTSIKATLAKFLAVTSDENRQINASLSSLRQYSQDQGAVIGLTVTMMTWAENNAYGIDEIQLRRSKLWRVFESWGGVQVSDKGGDPIACYVSNLMGVNNKSVATKTAAPLTEALRLLPWCRQASPFTRGTILNRTVDGKLLKLECFSAELHNWIKIYIGKPGSGKSMAMNYDIVESCLMPGITRLPIIFMVDVGLSSSGVVNLLRDRLSPDQRHLAVYKRLRNNRSNAINPLDCAVGRMMPTPDQLNQITAFLSTLITPVESRGQGENGLSNFLNQVIEQTFIMKLDGDERGNPNRYQKAMDLELDQRLEKIGIVIDPFDRNVPIPSYYELVNLCHERGEYRARDLCHRYAMPTLADCIKGASSNEIQRRYEEAATSTGEKFISMFTRGIQEAISMYPIFAEHTQFDIDTARVVSLDLQDVIGTDEKQSSLFFQIARIFIKRKTAFAVEDLPLFPPNYQAYYRSLIREIMEDKKIYSYDELHNAKADAKFFGELKRDSRELRKWNAELKLASQYPEDFGDIPQSGTMFVIADPGNSDTRETLRKMIDLRPEDLRVLAQNVGLTPTGLVYLSKTVTKKGGFVSINVLTVGAKMIWSLTSDGDDRALKTLLLDVLPERVAYALLAKEYPYGIRAIVDAKKEALTRTGKNKTIDVDAELGSMFKIMAKEMIDQNQTFINELILKQNKQR